MENMRQWLRTRGAPLALPATTVGHEAHGTHASGTPMMPGMLSAGEMDALERSTGAEFERRFLAGMIKHHEGALVMVRELFGTPGAAEETAIFSFASGRRCRPACGDRADAADCSPPSLPAERRYGLTVWISTRDACCGVRQTRCVCALKSSAFASKMFGTQVCGFRSMIGNQLLCTCTMIRWPFRNR
jgi:hypothetical protein